MSRCYAYVGEFERLTERIGYWVDTEHAYYTFHPSYVESVWWDLKQLFENGLLYEDYKVIPYCPRCETGLSSHELGQPDVYADETDESAYVKFRLTDAGERGELGGATHLAVWTTTPWTLLSNVAVAVNPEVSYARSRWRHRGRRARHVRLRRGRHGIGDVPGMRVDRSALRAALH